MSTETLKFEQGVWSKSAVKNGQELQFWVLKGNFVFFASLILETGHLSVIPSSVLFLKNQGFQWVRNGYDPSYAGTKDHIMNYQYKSSNTRSTFVIKEFST